MEIIFCHKMSHLYCLIRNIKAKSPVLKLNARIIQKLHISSNSSSSSSNSSDDEKKSLSKVDEKKKSEETRNKLNNLLKMMIEDDVVISKTKLNLAKPISKRKKLFKGEKEIESQKAESSENQIITAVKSVAETIGGDVKQTESELLKKLLKTTNEDRIDTNLSDIVKGMKIEREDTSRAEQVRQILQNVEQKIGVYIKHRLRTKIAAAEESITLEKVDLFGSEPLGFFTDSQNCSTEGVQSKTWEKLYERDLKLAITHPPSNYFQQMVLWTEQGKLWKFPIDNEQGLEEEQNVYFAEHVFLEQHLEPWCPQTGPIRHFMELVCVGLSKNPYLTVEGKKEHIEWFKNYFEDKKQLLHEVGALQGHNLSSVNETKQIE